MKTGIIKNIISLLLTVVLGTGGYMGTAYVIAGVTPVEIISGDITDPRDNTGYKPVGFQWNGMEGAGLENSNFLAGKYVRNDGNAVLYIDYEHGDGSLYFVFELFIRKTQDQDELQTGGYADITGKTAIYAQLSADEYLHFESIRAGVIQLEADLYDTLVPADGMYYIVRAKYDETPEPEIEDDTSRSSSVLNRWFGGGGGGFFTPKKPTGDITDFGSSPAPGSNDPGFTGTPLEGSATIGFESVTPYTPKDPVGTVAENQRDGPGKTDKEIAPQTPEETEQFMEKNGMQRTAMDTTGIGDFLHGKRGQFTGTATVRFDYMLDGQAARAFYRNNTGYREEDIDALLAFAMGGGFVGDTLDFKMEYQFVEGDKSSAIAIAEGPEHEEPGPEPDEQYHFFIEAFDGDNNHQLPGLAFARSAGFLIEQFNSAGKTMTVCLQFGYAPDGTVIAQGIGIMADDATSRMVVEINLKAAKIE